MISKKYAPLQSKTILYAEDDITLQENIKEVLGHFFKEVLIASDGDEAYSLYIENQNKIDIIVTDINMPHTDGITFAKLVRKEYDKKIPIVIISAYTNTDYLLDSINLNILTYITKPLTTNKTMELMDKFLEYFQLDNALLLNEHIQFNCANGLLSVDKKEIQLSKKESKFFKLLNEEDIVSYDMMYEYLWDYNKPPSEDAMKSFVKKFKKKLPKDLCKNQQGVGYWLNRGISL